MPEDPTAQQPEPNADPAAQQPQEPAKQPEPAPPWGSDEEFKPEKAWNLIQDLRKDKERLASRPVLTDEAKQQLDEYNRLVEASKSDLERSQEELNRWQTEAQRWRDVSVTSRIEALAAPDFAFPADAVAKLDPAQYIDAGGTIDDTAIRRDLAAILEERPNWRRATEPAKPRVPAPNPDQGSGGGGKPASDPRQEFAAILQSQLK